MFNVAGGNQTFWPGDVSIQQYIPQGCIINYLSVQIFPNPAIYKWLTSLNAFSISVAVDIGQIQITSNDAALSRIS
jgi:hypothetical protein